MKKYKIAVIGMSFGGRMTESELINNDYFELDSVCDLDEEKAKTWAEKFSVPYFTDMDKLFNERNIQAVALITGPKGRGQLIQKCADRGIHVMTTKPFELSQEKARAALDYAEEKGIQLFVNSPRMVPTGEIRRIREMIRDYDLGRPIAYYGSTWCSYREKADGTWYDDPSVCPVAPVFRLGVYLINELSQIFQGVESVNVSESRIFTERPTSDNASLTIQHTNGAIGTVFASFCIDDMDSYKCSYILHFERGSIYKGVLPTEDRNEVALQLSCNYKGSRVMLDERIHINESGYQWKEFYDAIGGNRSPDYIGSGPIVSAIQILEKMKENARIK